MSIRRILSYPRWLIASIAIYLLALLRINDSSQFVIAALYCIALTQLEPIRTVSSAKPSGLAKSLGIGIITLTCFALTWLMASYAATDDVMNRGSDLALTRAAPFLIGVAAATLANGWKGLVRWRPHLLLAFCLGVPLLILVHTVDLSPWTAATAERILLGAGYEVVRDGVHLRVGAGPAVQVYPGCSGVEAVCYLFGLAFVCLETFPTSRHAYAWLPAVAVLIGFVTNCLRVGLMAVLLASGDRDAFTYWHIGDGAQLFGIAAVFVLGISYALILWLTHASCQKAAVS